MQILFSRLRYDHEENPLGSLALGVTPYNTIESNFFFFHNVRTLELCLNGHYYSLIQWLSGLIPSLTSTDMTNRCN